MSSKLCKAILDTRVDDFDGINNQARRFLDNLYKHPTEYASPPITESEFKAMTEKSETATSNAIEGSKHDKTVRNYETENLHFAMGNKLIPYINGLYIGNRPMLELSGAKTSIDPSPVPGPERPTIKRVEKGPESGTVKIYLVRGENKEQKRRGLLEYRIFMFEHEEDTEGKEIGNSFNSYKLIGKGVPSNVYRFFSVMAVSRGGSSMLASKVRFYLLP